MFRPIFAGTPPFEFLGWLGAGIVICFLAALILVNPWRRGAFEKTAGGVRRDPVPLYCILGLVAGPLLGLATLIVDWIRDGPRPRAEVEADIVIRMILGFAAGFIGAILILVAGELFGGPYTRGPGEGLKGPPETEI